MIAEIGPHPTLNGPIQQILVEISANVQNTPILCPMRRRKLSQDVADALPHAMSWEKSCYHKFLGDAYVQGCSINWRSVFFWPSPMHQPVHSLPR